MKMRLYSIFDSKLASFDRPFVMLTDAAAIRSFRDAVNDRSNPNNQWAKHPEDFSLFFVGEFEDDLGKLQGYTPLSLVTASAVVDLSNHVPFNEGQIPKVLPDA